MKVWFNYGIFGICLFWEIIDWVYINLDFMLFVGVESFIDWFVR